MVYVVKDLQSRFLPLNNDQILFLYTQIKCLELYNIRAIGLLLLPMERIIMLSRRQLLRRDHNNSRVLAHDPPLQLAHQRILHMLPQIRRRLAPFVLKDLNSETVMTIQHPTTPQPFHKTHTGVVWQRRSLTL